MNDNIYAKYTDVIIQKISALNNDVKSLTKMLNKLKIQNNLYKYSDGYINPYTNIYTHNILDDNKLNSIAIKHKNLFLEHGDMDFTLSPSQEIYIPKSLLDQISVENKQAKENIEHVSPIIEQISPIIEQKVKLIYPDIPVGILSSNVFQSNVAENKQAKENIEHISPIIEQKEKLIYPDIPPSNANTPVLLPKTNQMIPSKNISSNIFSKTIVSPSKTNTPVSNINISPVLPPDFMQLKNKSVMPHGILKQINILGIDSIIDCTKNKLGMNKYILAFGQSHNKITCIETKNNFKYVIQIYFASKTLFWNYPCIKSPPEIQVIEKILENKNNIHVAVPLKIDKCLYDNPIKKLNDIFRGADNFDKISINIDKFKKVINEVIRSKNELEKCIIYTINEYGQETLMDVLNNNLNGLPFVKINNNNITLYPIDIMHILFQLVWQLYYLALNNIAHRDQHCNNILFFEDLNYDINNEKKYTYNIFDKEFKIPIKSYIVKFIDFDRDIIINQGNTEKIIKKSKIKALVEAFSSLIANGINILCGNKSFLLIMIDILNKETDQYKKIIVEKIAQLFKTKNTDINNDTVVQFVWDLVYYMDLYINNNHQIGKGYKNKRLIKNRNLF